MRLKQSTHDLSVAMLFVAIMLATPLCALADSFGNGLNTFTIDFVGIGNADNAADVNGYGHVPYYYRVSTFEISQDAILKATGSGLANVQAGPWARDEPAALINWYEAAAFVNWLNTNSGYQEAYNLTYTSGAWIMQPWESANAWTAGGTNLYRHKNAHYFLPSENEWYKAAYYNQAGSNYFLYPTAADSVPTAVASGTNAGTAIYGQLFRQRPAGVNVAGGLSPYGTMAQGGNVWEWIETAYDGANTSSSEPRALRGGDWGAAENCFRSSFRVDGDPTSEFNDIGFRVASVQAAIDPAFLSPDDIPITADSFTAAGSSLGTVSLGFAPAPGQQLRIVKCTGNDPVGGTFTGLAEGATLTAAYGGNTFTFRISYSGWDGNDITLTRVAAAGQTLNSSGYAWSVFAGNLGGVGSRDAFGTAASFFDPNGTAVDSAGNVYVADRGNHTIRKISPAGAVTTLAGSPGMSGSDDGTGDAARFNGPSGVTVDGAGNVYVSDRDNFTIRKISPAGAVTTLAGSPGMSGSDDGTGDAARFNQPSGLAVDGAGNVYVADSFDHTIRKVTAAGVVTTFAGLAGSSGSADGAGSTARFKFPEGVAVDSGGNVYVADGGNRKIRKVTAAGVVSSLAGAGFSGNADGTGSAAQFNYPLGVAVDAIGNVYVADGSNGKTIRKVTAAGVVTTLAGQAGFSGNADGTGSAARFGYPLDVAVDLSGNVYVADADNNSIRKVTPAGVVTTLAGRVEGYLGGGVSFARFNNPADVAVDGAGNVYVADAENSCIRKITPAGAVTILAGSPGTYGSSDGTGSAAHFNGPIGVAVDGAGNVYVADSGNHTIRKVTPAGVVTTLAGQAGFPGSDDGTGSAARFFYPLGVAVDLSGNVYVADTVNSTIRKVTPAGVVTTLAGSAEVSGSDDGTGSAARFNGPEGVAVDSAGNVYVADFGNQTIRKVTAAGVVTTLAGQAGFVGTNDGTGSAALFADPSGVAVDSTGNVYVADSLSYTIRKVTAAGVVTTVAGAPFFAGSDDGTGSAARFNNPGGLAVDGAGNVYVADRGNHTIRKVTAAGVVTTAAGRAGSYGFADSSARLDSTADMAVDGAGNVYVNDFSNCIICKVTPAGAVEILAGKPGSAGGTDGSGSTARFAWLLGMALDGAGNVYVSDGNKIRKVSAAGVVTTLAGSSTSGAADGSGIAAQFGGARGVAVDGAGNVYVADFNNHTIRKVTAAGVVTTLAGSAGVLGAADGTGTAARFNGPAGVAVDGTGNVYVTDFNNHTIRKVTAAGVVTTLAGQAGFPGSADGTGDAARFNHPSRLAVDGAGNVYVTDSYNHTIRKVTPAGVVSTIGGLAGSFGHESGYAGAARFYYPNGIGVSSSGVVYATDRNRRIVQGRLSGFEPILGQSSVSGLGSSTATLNGSANPNGYVTAAYFEYGTSISYGNTTNLTLSPGNGISLQSVSTPLSGLTPSTTYYYRLTATNVDGTRSTSGGSFTTTAATPSGFSAWSIAPLLPADRRGPADRNGPYNLPNLLSYGMGVNPLTATTGDLPALGAQAADTIKFTFRRAKNVSDVSLNVNASTNLAAWTAADVRALNVIQDGGSYETVEATVGVPPGTARFFLRLQAK